MGKPQKGKGNKRRKSWHRGKAAARHQARALDRLPDVGSGADPTEGAPQPLRRVGSKNRGDALS